MFVSFMNSHFIGIMVDLLKVKGIEPIIEEKRSSKELFQYEETLDDCFKPIDYRYFFEAISRLLKRQGYELAHPDFVSFKTVSHKDNGKIREDIFALRNEKNSYSILGKTRGSIKTVLKQVFFGKNGISEQFDIMCKGYLDKAFQKGLLAFSNYYNSQLHGLNWLEAEINSDIMKKVNSFKQFGLTDEASIKRLFSNMELGCRNFYDNYKFSIFIMSVYSFVEHVAVLILPFWFAMRDTDPSWNLFCRGFHASGFDTFRDFWNSNDDWINSFIEVVSDSTEWNGNGNRRGFCFFATDDQKLMKRLYDRTRKDYRNPIHHGYSTGKDKTGLSMEVPTLNADKKLNFVDPPLLREIDSKAYNDTKDFLTLFVKILKKKYSQIMEYIETGLNVPTDCTELCNYIIVNNISEFIEACESLSSHVDYEQLAGVYR